MGVVLIVVILIMFKFIIGFKNKPVLSDVEILNDEGFITITIPFTKMVVNKHKEFEIKVEGLRDGKVVGLFVTIKGNMSGGIERFEDDTVSVKEESFYKDGIIFKSLGESSNKLMDLITEQFGVDNNRGFSKEPVGFTCFSLESEELGVDFPKSHFKLFVDKTEEGYAELYFNVDLEERKIEIMEKDPEYRSNIIAALTAQAFEN